MVRGVAAFGFAGLCLAFATLELFTFLYPQCGAGTGTTTSAEAPLLHSAAEVFPPLAAVVVLFIAVALNYHHLTGRRVVAVPVAGAGNGRRSISRLVMFALCVSAGTLEFIVFGQATGGGAEDHGGAQARALAMAALRALPAAATGTFFSGMSLIIVAHVHAGGEGGGTGAVAGDELIQGLLRLLTKVVVGAAAALVGLIAMALTFYGAKC
ncbi:uncharacterized protein [Miscanthus floridulus]|uniref:uncharacterized protein n=1 Tax=Miscanthus floridulus TaxID=154761 RepID=UPI00345A748F